MRCLLAAAMAGAAALCPATADAQTAPSPHADTTVEASTGIAYQQGTYGLHTDIELLSSTAALKITHGGFSVAASLPYVRLSAPANVVTGGGILGVPIIVPPTTSTERRTRSGIGDLQLTGAYTLSSAPVGLSLSAPYLHDGSAQTLEVVARRHKITTPNGQGGVNTATILETLTQQELTDLLSFVRSIDDETQKFQSETDVFIEENTGP